MNIHHLAFRLKAIKTRLDCGMFYSAGTLLDELSDEVRKEADALDLHTDQQERANHHA